MGNIFPNIKPTGLNKRELVDVLYMIVYSIQTLCTKIDADASAGATTHLANCYTAIFNCLITDSKGNRVGQGIAESSTVAPTHIIGPGRIDDKSLNAVAYQIVTSLYTLCAQLDTEAVSFTNYVATAYTAVLTQRIEDAKGNSIGAGTDFTFKPGGMFHKKQLVEFIYKCLDSIKKICAAGTTYGLDSDGYTDTTYTALCYTAIFLLMVENGAGSRLGVSR